MPWQVGTSPKFPGRPGSGFAQDVTLVPFPLPPHAQDLDDLDKATHPKKNPTNPNPNPSPSPSNRSIEEEIEQQSGYERVPSGG